MGPSLLQNTGANNQDTCFKKKTMTISKKGKNKSYSKEFQLRKQCPVKIMIECESKDVLGMHGVQKCIPTSPGRMSGRRRGNGGVTLTNC